MCSAEAKARPPATTMTAAAARAAVAAVLWFIAALQPDEVLHHVADGLEAGYDIGEGGLVLVACLAVVAVAPGGAVDPVAADAPASGGVAVMAVPQAGY